MIGHWKEYKSWRFEHYPFVRAIGGIMGCVWVYKQKMEPYAISGNMVIRKQE